MATIAETLPSPLPVMIPDPRSGVKLSGIQRDELLFPRSSVVIEAPKPLDADAARRAIGIVRANNAVKIGGKARKATWTPPDDLPPGRHLLQVGPLIGADGTEVTPEISIPFTFVQTKARPPANVAIESMVRFRMTANGPQRLSLLVPARGKFIEIMKGSDRRTQAPVELAFNEQGRRVDATRALRAAERKRAAVAAAVRAGRVEAQSGL